MTTKERKTVQVGQIYRTPFVPSGRVKVTDISVTTNWGEIAYVEFIEEHPHGEKGSSGVYLASELITACPTSAPHCEWTPTESGWSYGTACGGYCFVPGGVGETGYNYKFCPYCGKPITISAGTNNP